MAVIISFAHFFSKSGDFRSEMGCNSGGGFAVRGHICNERGEGRMMYNVLILII